MPAALPAAGAAARVVRGGAAAWEALLDALFPPRCAGCNRLGFHFCSACIGSLRPVPPPWCSSCGAPILGGELCGDCRPEPLPLAGLRSAGILQGPIRRAIHRLKYAGRQAAAPTLASLLLPAITTLPPGTASTAHTLVVPVPLHRQRVRERGYNQAALLARPLAHSLGLPCTTDLLERVRPTPPQVGLSRPERRANVRGAFAASSRVAGRHMLLVDDVATTGSTLASAADACLMAGALSVAAVTLAREI